MRDQHDMRCSSNYGPAPCDCQPAPCDSEAPVYVPYVSTTNTGYIAPGATLDPADPVNKPEHYIAGRYECADVVAALGLSFFAGSAFKYIWRHGRKDPSKKVEDLRKAVAMLNREIARLERP